MTTISQAIGEELDKQARRDRDYLPQPHDREVMQGVPDEKPYPVRGEVEPLDYKTADSAIGVVQHFLLHTGNHLTSEMFGVMYRELAKLRGKLRNEKQERFTTKGKA